MSDPFDRNDGNASFAIEDVLSAGNEFLKGLTTQWAMNNGGDIIVPITDPKLVKILEKKAQESPAFLVGKSLGDIISILQGLLEIGSGGIEGGSGIALAPTTGSASLVLTVDGAIRIVHGGKVIISATGSLTKTLSDLGEDFTHFLESQSSQNTPQSRTRKPRRNVQSHDNAGGHTNDRHIGKSERWLRKRLAENPDMDIASSFDTEANANLTQARFIKKYKKEIDIWLKGKKNNVFNRTIIMDREIGIVVSRHGKVRSSKKARVILGKNTSELGYRAVTSYPIP